MKLPNSDRAVVDVDWLRGVILRAAMEGEAADGPPSSFGISAPDHLLCIVRSVCER